MTENTLNLVAMGIELGIPALLLLGCWLFPRVRVLFVITLVAISPVLLLYLAIAISHATHQAQVDFAFSAMWLMTFLPYMVLLTIGFAIGLIRYKTAAKLNSSSPAA